MKSIVERRRVSVPQNHIKRDKCPSKSAVIDRVSSKREQLQSTTRTASVQGPPGRTHLLTTIFAIMEKFAFCLILLICTSGASSVDCDSKLMEIFGLTGAVVTEVPVVSTFVNLFNSVLSQDCVGKNLEEMISRVAMDQDRKQEARHCAGKLKGFITNMEEIRNYDDLKRKFNTYNNLRHQILAQRMKCFDAFEHHHENKFKLFVEYASIELTLIDMMIHSSGLSNGDISILERAYGDALLYYIQKGGHMLIAFPIKLAHDGDEDRSESVAKFAAEQLRPSVIAWMEAVERKREVRKRLRHKGLDEKPSDGKSQWINMVGKKNAKYLPLKISDGDWVALKGTSRYWLGCWNSIRDEDYCNTKATCPGVIGGRGNNVCNGERFQIQTTRHGPIRLTNNHNDKIAFRYWDWDCSSRGRGTYWLSSYHDPAGLYTMPCVGSSFSDGDISRCVYEVFDIEVLTAPDGKYFPYLRNGDYIWFKGADGFNQDKRRVFFRGFLLEQYHQDGDKTPC